MAGGGDLKNISKRSNSPGQGSLRAVPSQGDSSGAPSPGEAVPDPEVESCPARVVTSLPPPSPLAGLPVVQTQQKPKGARAQVWPSQGSL